MLRTPPNNLEAEAAVLGSILVDNEAYWRVAPFIIEEHFFEPEHGRLYAACAKLITGGKRASAISLKHETDRPEYLGQITIHALSPSLAVDMAKLVRDLASRRAIVTLAEDLAQRAQSSPLDTPANSMIEAAETSLAALAMRGIETRQVSLTDALTDALEVVAAAYQRDNKLVGISTGLHALDDKLGGLVPSELVILAARPGMGKSALATNIAYYVAEQGTAVGFFTVEMSAQQLAMRLLGERCGISAHRLRRGEFAPESFDHIIASAQQLQQAPIRFDETGGITVAQLSARARRWKRQYGIGLVVVDYLQLMAGSKQNREGRVQEVSEITAGLKALAKELNIPVLALSQLSRKTEERESKRPQLSDLRESGSIEQDADVVMFIFREDYYQARNEPKDAAQREAWAARMAGMKGRAELIIAKQRHGPIGTVELQFDAHLTRFSDPAQPALLEAAE